MSTLKEKKKAVMDQMVRDAVYEGAVRILAESGADALTMERLATTSGISRATLYNYFSDRDAVLLYLEERFVAPLIERFEDILGSETPADSKLEELFRSAFRFVNDERTVLLALYPKETREGPRRDRQQERREAFRGYFASVVEQGGGEGLFRPVEPTLAGQVIAGIALGMVDAWVDRDEFPPVEEVLPGLMSLLLGGLAPESP